MIAWPYIILNYNLKAKPGILVLKSILHENHVSTPHSFSFAMVCDYINYLGHTSPPCHRNCTLIISFSRASEHKHATAQSLEKPRKELSKFALYFEGKVSSLTSFSLTSYLDECFPWLFLLSFFRSVFERSRESCFSLCSE